MALSINTGLAGARNHSSAASEEAAHPQSQAVSDEHVHTFQSPSVSGGGFPPLPAHAMVAMNDAVAAPARRASSPQDIFTDGTIKQKTFHNLEHGPLAKAHVHAIVLHRTDSATAESTLAGYKTATCGAHYLIDKDGTIYQTASTDKKVQHVGNIRSRHEVEKTQSPQEKREISALQAADKSNYGKYVRDLHHLESGKNYPDRYPTNEDSIGIEVVGKYDRKTKSFEAPTQAQKESVARLVEGLKDQYNLSNTDIYHHGEISYKDDERTEGTGMGY